ncbi:hypothetical protein BK131_03395 [Paenibacillus amylolyticus]|uniref:Phage abortive infection protein n=1 Tax=Paenibacillus amylolyticus TaxID=1451 RepID=A0A1R1C4H1_PAEAM|nr:hypothetical protein [Paenibacillus amylolyticus]OMF17032.1 hypothetical protein BK131_03395 [Paenibacillus amylolyticus]
MKIWPIVCIIIGVIFVWASSSWLINGFIDASYRGTFGDMFGAVNALFSGLAFAGLIYTIAVQRQELQAQRNSINMQTEELVLQREAIQMQTEELRLQRLESQRSADQLEGQKDLSNLQLAMSVVNDLIKTKQERLDTVAVSTQNTGWESGELAFRRIINENKGIAPYSKSLTTYIDLYFYILSFINSYDLKDEQKTLLQRLLRMHTIDEEIKVLYLAAESTNNQYRLGLLSSAGF